MSSSEWKKESFGEWAKVIPGYSFKSGDFGDVGIPIVKIAEINPPRVEIHNCKRIVPEKLTGLSKYKLRQGDIVVAMTGATIGKIGRIYEDVTAYLNQRVAKIENIQGKSDKNFIYYLLTLKENNDQIIQLGSGSAQPNFSGKDLENLQFSFPDLETQKKVAYIFTSIDDKIENNLATNQTLEEIARTLFKEWFVNFNYPNADGNLKQSEFGDIPESWEVGTLGDIYKTTSGGTPSRSKPEYYENGSIGWVKSKELNNSFIIDTEEKITEDALKNSSAKLLPKHSVLIAMYGATVGEIGIITDKFTCNQAICAFLPNELYPFSFIYNFLLSSKQDIISRAVGSAQQNISQQLLLQYKLVIPPSELVQEFHRIVFPLFQKIQDNIEENESLKDLRDSLLPKLMSGEIIVNPSTTQ